MSRGVPPSARPSDDGFPKSRCAAPRPSAPSTWRQTLSRRDRPPTTMHPHGLTGGQAFILMCEWAALPHTPCKSCKNL
eukprot:365282-Chlamydomonas_euryale.AAC.4